VPYSTCPQGVASGSSGWPRPQTSGGLGSRAVTIFNGFVHFGDAVRMRFFPSRLLAAFPERCEQSNHKVTKPDLA